MILYCKNTPVYDIDSEHVYTEELLPGLMHSYPKHKMFDQWMRTRYSSNTNISARRLKGVTFGQGNRRKINRETRALCLSDSYWVKDADDPITFEQISPYYAPFWRGDHPYNGQSVPTLYVSGYMNKEWISLEWLHKYGESAATELCAIRLCQWCIIPVNEAYAIPGGIAVKNITSPEIMLEQADQSGRLDVDDYTVQDIVQLYGIGAIQMLTIDAITANGDRHPGNFGWYRDTETGAYLGLAPLYDFDHALDSDINYGESGQPGLA